MDECDIVDAVAEVREQVADPFTALATLREFPAWFNDATLVLVAAAAECFHFDRFAVHADHCRFVIERVDVTWPAIHEKEDDAFGLSGQQRWLGRERIRELCCSLRRFREEAVA